MIPQKVKDLIIQRAKEDNESISDVNDLDDVYDLFIWSKTIEGIEIWVEVSEGNLKPLYDFHGWEYDFEPPKED